MIGRRALMTAMAGLSLASCAPGRQAPAATLATGNPVGLDPAALNDMVDVAPGLGPIHTLMVAQHGTVVAEHHFAGPGPERPANIKSLSKTILSALVGIAIDRGHIEGPDQPIVDLLGTRIPAGADPAIQRVTVDHLLSMRAGLERTSGSNYGRWVASNDWVGFVLSRPFVAAPGESMQYSTGTWHVLSEILTRRTGRTTYDLAQEWLAEPLGISIPQWPRDPQGLYFGGNDMNISPADLIRFGNLYLDGGVANGRRILTPEWIEASWTPRGVSPWSNDAYGFGWFMTELGGVRVWYGRGYGGQLLHVIPDLGVTVAITSRPSPPSAGGGYVRALHQLVETHVIAGARI